MTSPGRLMSPALSFSTALKGAQATTSQAKGTITKTDAEPALKQLAAHPHASAADRAQIVQAFIDGTDASALSPKAKDVLADFVKQQSQSAPGGQRADELKAAASTAAKTAERSLTTARARLESLLAEGGRVKKSELAPVQQALDGAKTAVDAARQSLTGVLQIADHGAKLAATQLTDATAEIDRARTDVARLVAQKGGVTRKTIDTVTAWLKDPVQELQTAQKELGTATTQSTGGGHDPGEITLKYPSDAEDGGTAGDTVMVTMKFPSDHEDGGPGPAGPGPGTLPPLGGVKQVRLDAMRKVLTDVMAAGTSWQNSMPIGQRTETAFLQKERHPDGFQFDAIIPVGALTPTAPRADVNTVDTFWLRRTGGIAGLTQYAGPFSLNAATPTL